MQKLFPVFNRESQRDRLQSRLMIIAALTVLTLAILLSLAPMVRLHSVIQNVEFKHWLGLGVWALGFALLHHQTTRKLPQRDPYILPIVAMLTGIGLMTIWRLYPNLGLRQTLWLALASLIVIMGLQFPQYLNYLRQYKYLWLVAGLIMTGLTILLGINPSGSGPTLWLDIFGVHFQPSELLKLLLIVFFAGYFSDARRLSGKFLERLVPTLVVVFTAILLLIFQRDLGTASIFLLLYLGLLISTHHDGKYLWLAPLLFGVLGLIGYMLIGTVQTRIDTWLNPFGDPSGASYQIVQSLIAMAEGSWIGTGPGLGSPAIVPVSVSDFIFSAITEELGWVGALLVLALVLLLVYRGTKISLGAETPFYRFLAIGLTFYFGMQSALIIGGNLGLLPLTGVTLPFVSYGGSSLVISFIAILMLLSTSEKNKSGATQTDHFNKRITLVSGLLMGLLVVEIVLTSVITFWYQAALVNRPDNPRWIIDDRYVPRGNILDRGNRVIVTNTGLPGSYQRTSTHPPLYPVIGYTNPMYGQTGIEDSMFEYLRGVTGYPFATQFEQQILFNQPPEGLDVRLTLDLVLQQRSDSLLEDALEGEAGGAIVLMNAQSGEILVMSSYPYFDAADLETSWEDLTADPAAPLINRAAQGQYPAGSALFPFLAVSQEDLLADYPEPGELITSSPHGQTCAAPLNGETSWNALITNGCQEAFRELLSLMDASSVIELFDSLGFYSPPNLSLAVAQASPAPVDLDPLLVVESLKISPLQAAIAAAALTNQGTRPGPRIVNAYQDPESTWVTLPKFSSSEQSFTASQTAAGLELIKTTGASFWESTATAEAEDNKPVTWYISGTTANWQGQPLVVVVVLEGKAAVTAKDIGAALLLETLNMTMGQ